MKRLVTLTLTLVLVAAACSGASDSNERPGTIAVGTTLAPRAPQSGGSTDQAPDNSSQAATTLAPSRGTDGLIAEGDAQSRPKGERDDQPLNEQEQSSLYRADPRNVTFQDYGENPYVETDEDNLSTFAVDVDTGSYTVMRGYWNQGLTPPPTSVRPEEYVNFFDAGYEAPSRGVFAVYADGAPTPFLDYSEDILVRIGIKGEEIAARSRPNVNLTFVIDTSGSMDQDNRLGLVQDSLAVLLNELGRGDTIAIVSYNKRAEVVVDPTSADEARNLQRAIDQLHPGGSTNAEAGLILGYDLAEQMYNADEVNKVILLSDGVANVGETGPGGIFERIEESANNGIDLLTVGVGLDNYNDVLLEQLADTANGQYRYIDTLDEANRVFRDDLLGTLVTIARNVKVQVEFDPDVVRSYRLVGFENRDVADRDFRDDRVDGGEIGAGHSVTALYEVELVDRARRDVLGTVFVRWESANSRDVNEISGDITLDLIADRWDDADPRFRLAATVAAF
ncbi:MAG TPA: DUF3520 domain-containing protein, partial [Actinobacteria bacterium]|nr:DUF3520 domain-containing protein [Actinomycetota bacterium]